MRSAPGLKLLAKVFALWRRIQCATFAGVDDYQRPRIMYTGLFHDETHDLSIWLQFVLQPAMLGAPHPQTAQGSQNSAQEIFGFRNATAETELEKQISRGA